ncbi:bifunctional oligoribonuclease/PAP phosphatase NrnA [Cytophagaceae bacterium 50C-KIRBA]|uniref:Bifunctional oligoribonuclease/PAP phosphatase NrnA n=1 Tax=Aquirufa beregesia TaxID=2516556 RepID=A0ABX0EYY3_9BACT|nr:bifunctional oligoribonuclease/PAP phosphatase NrnA [Aquirufa beregesia]NGZ45256.1 bifunctional oligoribonuclease/PAP phosphatase NrnA [Aquirufa beregesia]
MSSISALQAQLTSGTKAVITTHFNPDSDAIGSSLAWQNYLMQLGMDVSVIVPSAVSANLKWMPGAEHILNFEDTLHKVQIEALLREAAFVFCLDFSGMQRLHGLSHWIKAARGTKVVIDHHLNPEDFADYYYHRTTAASTCELIFDLIQEWGDDVRINEAMGSCLYSGIMTDTGSFRHPNTTAHVHEVVAQLIQKGVNTNAIHRNIFDSASIDRLRFLGHILANRLDYLPAYHLSLMWITEEDQKQFNSQAGDTEGIVNYGLQIAGAIWAILLIQRPDGIKLSFRSIEPFAVNEFASRYFEGGGHKNASGGRFSSSSIEGAKEKLEEVLPLYLSEINRVKNL